MDKIKYDKQIKDVLDSFLLTIPGIIPGKMFDYPAYYVGKKLFACVFGNGVGIKVPEELAKELVNAEGINYFQPMGRAKMRQWIQINRPNPQDYLKDDYIFKIAIDFVSKIE